MEQFEDAVLTAEQLPPEAALPGGEQETPQQPDAPAQTEREAEEAQAQRVFAADLAEIRQRYPEESAQSVQQLGMDFLRLRAAGVSNLAAYAAVRGGNAPAAAGTGDVGGGSGAPGGYFTPEQVDAMSDAQIRTHLDEILRSQMLWK